eukprot:4781717-Prymnesium_polylepis.1
MAAAAAGLDAIMQSEAHHSAHQERGQREDLAYEISSATRNTAPIRWVAKHACVMISSPRPDCRSLGAWKCCGIRKCPLHMPLRYVDVILRAT